MDKKFFIELTNDLYRLTILFPEEEPLRVRVRGLADDILTDLITILEGSSEEKIEAAKTVERKIGIMEGMLDIAKDQKWVKNEDFEEVEKKYKEIKEEITKFNKLQKKKKKDQKPLPNQQKETKPEVKKETIKEKEEKKEEKTKKKQEEDKKESGINKNPVKNIISLNKRQKEILEILENKNKVQVQDVIDNLSSDITKRTIRRDFKKLIKLGMAIQKGKANMTYYKLKEQTND
jgi:DNA-binding transcriptional ArsR family regulator